MTFLFVITAFFCNAAFGLLPFTASDPREAYIAIIQAIPEFAPKFMTLVTRAGNV